MIKFGTSGWRGVIGEDFTFRNVRLVTKALVNLMNKFGRGHNGFLVGYDTRFLSEKFAHETAKILTDAGFKTFLSDRDVPTPAISYKIISERLDGGINFTASNNTAEYNGLKFFSSTGCTALPEQTDLLEKEIDKIEAEGSIVKTPPLIREVETIDIREEYLEFVKEKIKLDTFINSDIKLGLDLLYGTARDYLDAIFYSSGCETHTIHNFRDPYFGGYSPQSTEENLEELKALIKEKNLDVGLATNADSDRFGVLDENGNYIHPNVINPLLLHYLAGDRELEGAIARSVATSHILDHVAKIHNLDVVETPVGFKYISSLFVSDKICFGGEESGGITLKGHVPIKDGILACALVAEMITRTGKPLSLLIKEMFDAIGQKIYFDSANYNISEQEKPVIKKKLSQIPSKLGDMKVVNVNQTDGVKLYLEDDSWVLIRFSGTEPKIRIYAEGLTQKTVDSLMETARSYYVI